LTLDGALGHVTEVLSGDFNQPLLGSSPHQIWSAAMVVNPLLRGLFGLEVDATTHRFTFAPHVPANWASFRIGHLHVGSASLDLDYSRTVDSILLDVQRSGSGDCSLEFSPALSLRAQVVGADINGHPVAFHVQANSEDQHVTIQLPLSSGLNRLRIGLRNDFGLSMSQELPPLGESSHGLRIVSESWTPAFDRLTLELSGSPSRQYDLLVWNPGQIASVEGAQLLTDSAGAVSARIQFPAGESSRQIAFHFNRNGKNLP
jgi:hypothetical protein